MSIIDYHLFILFLLFANFSFCQTAISSKEIEISNFEIGNCYEFQFEKNALKSDNQIILLELIQPVFEEKELVYSSNELNNIFNEKEEIKIQTKPRTSSFGVYSIDLLNTKKFNLCLRSNHPDSITIFRNDIKGDSINIKTKLLKSDSKIIIHYLDTLPQKLVRNQLLIEGGNLTIPKKIIRGCKGPNGNQLSLKIKQRLIEMGCDLIPNDILSREAVQCLIEFQKRNGITNIGEVDFETLRMIGLYKF